MINFNVPPLVGDEFEYIIELEVPKNLAIGNIGIAVSPHIGMRQVGSCENYPDRKPENPSNTVKRISIPVRYDVPFSGNVSFTLDVPYSLERRMSRGGFSFSSSKLSDGTSTMMSIRSSRGPDTRRWYLSICRWLQRHSCVGSL